MCEVGSKPSVNNAITAFKRSFLHACLPVNRFYFMFPASGLKPPYNKKALPEESGKAISL
jgi:hypothetical protein